MPTKRIRRHVIGPLRALDEPARYKGAKGGRASGKSHYFAEKAVLEMLQDPDLRVVCIREVQRSLKFSAKSLIEAKIRRWGLEWTKRKDGQFQILDTEIRRIGGSGAMIFEGMQDHTADSLKSLEGFGRAWVEEAHSLSNRSLEILLPTIRADGSEIWFSWNPDQPDDPVERLLVESPPANAVVRHINYTENRLVPAEMVHEAERMRMVDPDAYEHVWLGGYNIKSDAKVLAGKYRIDEFVPRSTWDGPYYGVDWGFAQDPTVLIRCWIGDRRLWIEHESYALQLDLDDTAQRWTDDVPEFADYVLRADNARPESISYMRQHGAPNIRACEKWSGSVEDGVAHLRQYEEIVIHPRCRHAAEEARLYSYKVDRQTGDVLPKIGDRHNHIWDAVRYAIGPLIQWEPEPFDEVFDPDEVGMFAI